MRFFVTRKFVIVTPAVLVFITQRSTVMRLTGYSVLIIAVNIALANNVVVVPVPTVYAKIDPDRGIRLVFPVAHPKDPGFFEISSDQITPRIWVFFRIGQ